MQFHNRLLIPLAIICFGPILGCGDRRSQNSEAVYDLLDELRDQQHVSAAKAELRRIGPPAIPMVIDAYRREPSVESELFDLLTFFASDHPRARESAAIVPLFMGLINSDSPREIAAITALGTMGSEARDAIRVLIPLLNHNVRSDVRQTALSTLHSIARDLQTRSDNELPKDVEQTVALLTEASEAANDMVARSSHDDREAFSGYAADLALTVGQLQEKVTRLKTTWAYHFKQHKIRYCVALFILSMLALPRIIQAVLLLKWFRTAHLVLNFHRYFERTAHGKYWLRVLFFPWHHLPLIAHILDAWVASQILSAQAWFNKDAERLRQTYRIPLPVVVDGKKRSNFEASELQEMFVHSQVTMVITGKGGCGKTNLAYELGRLAMERDRSKRLWTTHAAIPLIITNMKYGKADNSLLECVHYYVKEFSGDDPCVDERLIRMMLEKQRLVVIVDGYSELHVEVQQLIDHDLQDCPVNALVVTSRQPALESRHSTRLLEPCDLSRDNLAYFVTECIKREGLLHLFKPGEEEFDHEIDKLIAMLDNRPCSVLLARLYADLMQSKRLADDASIQLPGNVPDMMFAYINFLNRRRGEHDPTNGDVHSVIKLLAWRSIEDTYTPGELSREFIEAAIREVGLSNAKTDYAFYLLQGLQLLQENRFVPDDLRFTLEPLAEYMAAMFVIETYRDNTYRWARLIRELEDAQGPGKDISGFASALVDCCRAKGSKYHVPQNVEGYLIDCIL